MEGEEGVKKGKEEEEEGVKKGWRRRRRKELRREGAKEAEGVNKLIC